MTIQALHVIAADVASARPIGAVGDVGVSHAANVMIAAALARRTRWVFGVADMCRSGNEGAPYLSRNRPGSRYA